MLPDPFVIVLFAAIACLAVAAYRFVNAPDPSDNDDYDGWGPL